MCQGLTLSICIVKYFVIKIVSDKYVIGGIFLSLHIEIAFFVIGNSQTF